MEILLRFLTHTLDCKSVIFWSWWNGKHSPKKPKPGGIQPKTNLGCSCAIKTILIITHIKHGALNKNPPKDYWKKILLNKFQHIPEVAGVVFPNGIMEFWPKPSCMSLGGGGGGALSWNVTRQKPFNIKQMHLWQSFNFCFPQGTVASIWHTHPPYQTPAPPPPQSFTHDHFQVKKVIGR